MYKVIGGDGLEYQASSLDELKVWISGGNVGPQTLVSAPQGGGWKMASQCAELADSFREPIPPPRPAAPPVGNQTGMESRMPQGMSSTVQAQRSSSGAVLSLVLGVISVILLSPLVGLLAVVCGHASHWSIRRSYGAVTGKGMAIAGLIMGYIGIVVGTGLLLSFGALSGTMKSKMEGAVNAMNSDLVTESELATER